MKRRPKQQAVPNLAEQFVQLRSDYNAAKSSSLRRTRSGVSSTGRPADYHYRSESEFLRMLELARDYDRNDGVVGQGVTRAVDNVVHGGIKLDPRTGDKVLDDELLNLWNEWGEEPDTCHTTGEYDWHALESLVLRHVHVDGDICLLPRKDGTLETAEAHRLRTPKNTTRNVIHGILLDENRKRLEYWFTKENLDPWRTLTRVSEMTAIPARDSKGARQVFHVFNPKRVTQTRGVTSFAPIIDSIGMHDDIQFARLVQQQVVSSFAIFREREESILNDPDEQMGERETETLSDGTTRTLEGIGPGMDVTGAPGEKLQGFSPNVPNPEYFDFVRMVLTFIAINLGLPLHVFLLDPSQTNFSGWRGALDQAKIGFREIQQWLIAFLHRRVYRWKVSQWVLQDPAMGKVSQRDDISIYRHKWKPPSWPYIEPLKDASADLLRIRNGLTSRRRLHAERGVDWDEVSTEIVEDNVNAIRKAKTAALELNAEIEDGQPVTWREVLSLPTPDGVTVAVGVPEEGSGGTSGDNRDGGVKTDPGTASQSVFRSVAGRSE